MLVWVYSRLTCIVVALYCELLQLYMGFMTTFTYYRKLDVLPGHLFVLAISFLIDQCMGMFGKVVVISCGVFLGGGVGFYLKETYYVRQKKDRCYQLQEEWKELSDIRKAKEQQLNSIKQHGNNMHVVAK